MSEPVARPSADALKRAFQSGWERGLADRAASPWTDEECARIASLIRVVPPAEPSRRTA